MSTLDRQLRLANLRSRDSVTATITDIEDTTADGTDVVELTYTFSGNDIEVERTDQYPVPDANTAEFAFVRLCRDLHIPLEMAHEEIVDKTVQIHWTGEEWQIESAKPKSYQSDPGGSNFLSGELPPGTVVAFALAFPVISPFLYLHLRSRRGFGQAVAISVGGVVVWLACAVALFVFVIQ